MGKARRASTKALPLVQRAFQSIPQGGETLSASLDWGRGRLRVLRGLGVLLLIVTLFQAIPTWAATVPLGFTNEAFNAPLTIGGSTAMEFAPDGRLFLTEQQGSVRVVKNGTVLPTPFVTLTVDSTVERGLLGVTFHPDFANQPYVYFYYTVPGSPPHNRVSRFPASNDVASPGAEEIILELEDLIPDQPYHNAGAIHFGPDGKLYIAVGENTRAELAQSLDHWLGKILRVNPDGSFPADNPFYTVATPSAKRNAVWALGLRNPFNFAFQPGTGRMLINDVGWVSWEEINEGIAGANYGWPLCEGLKCAQPPSTLTVGSYRGPLLAYSHGGTPTRCAITGGDFYNPTPSLFFPANYVGQYFFMDLCGGWIYSLNPNTGTVASFAAGIGFPVPLKAGPDGQLYYFDSGNGTLNRIRFNPPAGTNQPPTGTISAPAEFPPAQYSAGETINFSGTGTDPESGPVDLIWSVTYHRGPSAQLVLGPFSGAGGSFTVPTVGEPVTGAFYRVHLTVRDGAGLVSQAVTRDITPRTANLSVTTTPAGLTVKLNGQEQATPVTLPGVVGAQWELGAISPQSLNGQSYVFAGWSDGGAATHPITVPASGASFTATFAPAPLGDTQPPAVAAVEPPATATDVMLDHAIQITFSEAMDASSFTSATVILVKQGDTTPIPVTLTYGPDSGVLTVKPQAPLALGASYTVTIKGGTGGVRDAAGNVLATDFTWSFTTVSSPRNLLAVVVC